MTTSAPSQFSHFTSPKRKRTPESIQYSPEVSPFPINTSTEIHEYPFPQTPHHTKEASEDVGDGSPRSAVAGALQELDLHGGFVRRLDFMDAGRARKRVAVSRDEDELPDAENATIPKGPEVGTKAAMDHSTTEPPRTPPNATRSSATPSPSDRPRIPTIIISTPQSSRRKSPPLHTSPDEDPLTWHDSEITGHNPTDPDDDGYGINGIGFRPTGAIAWARSQKRKQQVADYRSREAREARQRRSERRRFGSASGTASPVESPKAERKKGRVRFDGELAEVEDKAS